MPWPACTVLLHYMDVFLITTATFEKKVLSCFYFEIQSSQPDVTPLMTARLLRHRKQTSVLVTLH